MVSKIRQFIVKSRLKDGSRLPSEHEFCRRLQVSRPTVREALNVLETLGLVEKIPGRGPSSDAAPDRTGLVVTLTPQMKLPRRAF
ncbi:MAG: winged helix-turn-helix domain-containing protein [Candidatus Methylomirabilales bacterium]|nr:winged helix-turn-helix domain-containing protein [candidate division NC10 bacterium]MCZ6551788.1 winged helix-turn-helix domain-containing protein [candidate division NC10 bacterium]